MAQCASVKLAFKSYEAENVDSELTPIIFMHGMTSSKENWGDLPRLVANKTHRKVYAVDSRNHGDSDWSDEWNFDCNVDDLLHFMDTQGMSKATLVGHSMGGVTAFKTALRAPERVDGVFAEDMSTRPPVESLYDLIIVLLTLQKSAFQTMPRGLSEKEAKSFVLKHFYENMPEEMRKMSKFPDTKDELLSMKPTEDGRFMAKANLDVILHALKNPKNVNADFQGVYEGATSIIYGKLSPFSVGGDEDLIKVHFPNAELICVEDATHTVHSDCPAEFREALFKFLN